MLAASARPPATWFAGAFAAPTPAQVGAWDAIAAGRNALVVAPTGSGKTLAAFLWSLDRLATEPPPDEQEAPLPGALRLPAQGAGRRRRAQPARAAGRHPAHRRPARRCRRPTSPSASAPATPPPPTGAGSRTTPPDILITTPESLFLMLTSQARESLRGVETVIVDEVHAVAGTKRGAHLALSLERLDELLDAARAADRPVRDGAADRGGGPLPRRLAARSRSSRPPSTKEWDLKVVVPVEDMTELGVDRRDEPSRGPPPARERRALDLAARRGARRRPRSSSTGRRSSSPTPAGWPSG